MKTSDRNSGGFALVMAVWLFGLLAAVLASFLLKVRSENLIAANLASNARVELIADGLVRATALELATKSSLNSGTYRRCLWSSDVRVEILVQDQAGLIDLNTAPLPLLAQVIAMQGVAAGSAEALAAAIGDYRDRDNDSDGAAEPTLYKGENFGPKNAPFSVVEELQQVPGVGLQLFDQLSPWLTVHSFENGLDARQAPDALRRLIGGEGREIFSAYQAASKNFAVMIDVRVEAGNARFRRKAVAALHRQPERPLSFLTWQRDARWGAEMGNGGFVGSCVE
jgi:general secretion pathway protein K